MGQEEGEDKLEKQKQRDRGERNLSSNNLPFSLTGPSQVTHIPGPGVASGRWRCADPETQEWAGDSHQGSV